MYIELKCASEETLINLVLTTLQHKSQFIEDRNYSFLIKLKQLILSGILKLVVVLSKKLINITPLKETKEKISLNDLSVVTDYLMKDRYFKLISDLKIEQFNHIYIQSFYILDVKMAVHKLKPICCGHIAFQFPLVYPVDALFMSSVKTLFPIRSCQLRVFH